LAALWLTAFVVACDRPGARAPVPPTAAPPTISRADLFGDSARHHERLSPRGDRVAFLAPRDGVSNIWVLSVAAMDEARPLTDDRDRGVRNFVWAYDGATLLYLQDDRGDEVWRLYAVDANGGEPRALTPAGARAEIVALNPADPGGVVITLNQRDAAWPDLVRVDIASGERTVLHANTGARRFTRYLVDGQNQLRIGVRAMPDGSAEIWSRLEGGRWRMLFAVPVEDALSAQPIAFEGDGVTFLMLDTTGRDRAALVRVNAETGVKTAIGESVRADVVDVWLDPTTNAPEAFATEYLRRDWRALTPDAQGDLDFLRRQLSGDFNVVSRSLDNTRWIVVEAGPATPPRSYIYDRTDRAGRRLTQLFRHRPALEQAPLQPMTPIEIEARDGLTLVSYLTLPIGSDANADARPEEPVPLVIAPHDGPWARDVYGFNALHQWLANRGYAVLSVNVRGSTGFGKAFLNAGNREMGARMQEDLLDAVQWAVENGIAEPDRVAVVGARFGGYSAVSALAFQPQHYRCAVSYGAPLNLAEFIEAAPASRRDDYYVRFGDPRSAEGRQSLRMRSPLFRASQIQRPLLLALGARDAPISRADHDQLAQALRSRGALTYLVFPDEGRTLVRPANRLSYLAVLEHFLGDCLGGRVEPVGTAFEDASIHVFAGAVNVPGLTAFARRLPAPQPPPRDDEPETPESGAGGPIESAAPPPDNNSPIAP